MVYHAYKRLNNEQPKYMSEMIRGWWEKVSGRATAKKCRGGQQGKEGIVV